MIPLIAKEGIMAIELNYSLQKNKALYNNKDERQNLDAFESSEFNQSFITTVKKQAESVACLIFHHFLIKKNDEGWQLSPKIPTLAHVVEHEFQEKHGNHDAFGEQERFCNEYAAGFGTAFLVGKQLAMTAAHCICKKDTNIRDEKVIAATRIVFGFQNAHNLFADRQVYQIKKVISHQFTRIQDKNKNFTEWTDWALVELDREAPYTPLKMNMTKKVADKVELYMLGHPYGLPVKFVGNGFIQRNKQKDFFESNLDAFGGNSGSPAFNKITCEVEGMLCSGGEDYEITDNYRGTHQRRIQTHQITKQESGQKGFEICQRLNVLRFLLDDHLLGTLEVDQQQNTPELITGSLKEYYKSRNTIPRLLHSDLPINEIYTELVLLLKNQEADKKEEKKVFEEHRVNSWEDIHAAKEPIELNTLFKNQNGKTQKRLLILGRAGIGKSTLCQYIAHEWAEGKLWKEKFDALFWVPLRKLQHAHLGETASSFIFRHCCQEKSENLYANDVANYLKQHQERILFVLDGLDEVSMEENSLQKGIVDELLKFPHWIITSRPHATGSIQADSTIENVGFASKTIDLYIQKSFPINTQAVIQKIRQNSLIFGLCHIPINLELVCSILKKSKGNISSISSMTGLYEELTLTLQRRFLDKIGRKDAWQYEQGDLEQDPQVSPIFHLLESIAWTGMEQRQLFFSFKAGKMKEIYYSFPPNQERNLLFTQACTSSGFLQSTGDSEQFLQNEYSFLHLTFQEFFSARYLVRLLQNKPSEATKLIRGVKFDPRYKVVMWFTAGLLKNEGGDFESLNAFFEILDTPKDSVGLYSTLLNVRCLEECGSPNQLKHLKLYQQNIQSWCKIIALSLRENPIVAHLMETFEISPQGCKRFLIPHLATCLTNKSKKEEVAIVLNSSSSVTSEDDSLREESLESKCLDDEVRVEAIRVLGQIGGADPQSVLPSLIEALKDEKFEVRRNAATALGQLGHANLELVLPLLIEALKDKKERLTRGYVAQALGLIGQTDPQGVLPSLIETLKDEEGIVRGYVAQALGHIGQADPQGVLPLLTNALKDTDENVRGFAAQALGHIGQADPQSVLPLLTNALKDTDEKVREDVAQALGLIGQADPQDALPLLAEALKDKKGNVRNYAAKALELIGRADPQSVLPLLAEALKDEDWQVRQTATDALGKIGRADPQSVLPLLAKVLKDEDWTIRIHAAGALGKIGHADSQDVLPLLAKALKDEEWLISQDAAEALGQIGQADPQSVLPLLADALKDIDGNVRDGAAGALCKIGRADLQDALPLLAKALKDKDCNQTEITKTLEKYDLSSYIKSNRKLLYDYYKAHKFQVQARLLTSTPLSSLITCYKDDLSKPAIYLSAIALKCLEGNLAIFQEDDFLCFYEQGRLSKVQFQKASEFLLQIEHLAHRYPMFLSDSTVFKFKSPELSEHLAKSSNIPSLEKSSTEMTRISNSDIRVPIVINNQVNNEKPISKKTKHSKSDNCVIQ
jgi:HEAT repeat protein/V8-like Glu-specific endopeptidase